MKYLPILIVFFLSNCTFPVRINDQTECEYDLNGVHPMQTAIKVNSDVKLFSTKNKRYVILKKGIYLPFQSLLKCEAIMYASYDKIQTGSDNKFSNLFEKGEHFGGLQLNLNSKNNGGEEIWVWYFVSGTGYGALSAKNISDLDYEILYKNPNTLDNQQL